MPKLDFNTLKSFLLNHQDNNDVKYIYDLLQNNTGYFDEGYILTREQALYAYSKRYNLALSRKFEGFNNFAPLLECIKSLNDEKIILYALTFPLCTIVVFISYTNQEFLGYIQTTRNLAEFEEYLKQQKELGYYTADHEKFSNGELIKK